MGSNDTLLTMCQLNVCGLSNHTVTALDKFIADQNIDILALQEVGTAAHPPNLFSNKCMFTNQNGKGVALIVNSTLKPQIICDFSNDKTDDIWVPCTLGNKPALFGSGYCKPEINWGGARLIKVG